MKVEWYSIDNSILPELLIQLKKELANAFDLDGTGHFVVNPTVVFKKTGKGLNPSVINSAKYLSGKFQDRLVGLGWTIEYNKLDQKIDGFKEFKFDNVTTNYLEEPQFREYINHFDPKEKKYLSRVSGTHYKYFQRKSFILEEPERESLFNTYQDSLRVKVGLEFETGNIASSFRAISKLNYLFREGVIDVGIFVSSLDKATSTKIWPSSNRNGSLEELKNRKFIESIEFPHIVTGFSPNEWDKSAGFLGEDKTRFSLIGPFNEVEIDGKKYDYFQDQGYYVPKHNRPN